MYGLDLESVIKILNSNSPRYYELSSDFKGNHCKWIIELVLFIWNENEFLINIILTVGGAFDAPKHCHPVGNCPDDNRGCVDYCEERGFPEGSGKCQKHDQLCCCNWR